VLGGGAFAAAKNYRAGSSNGDANADLVTADFDGGASTTLRAT
jgi:hypothetical protein